MAMRHLAIVSALTLTLATVGNSTPSAAQSWPERNVRFVLPFGAGSATDITARMLQERLQTKWGKPVIVENKPGGDGIVAINAFTSAADDHVLLFASSASFMAHPYTQERMPYDLKRDLEPIARITDTIGSISVPVSSGFKSIKDFVDRARAEPDKFNVAGAAGVPEFTMMSFMTAQGLKVARVPYKDIVAAGTDLGEGRLQLLVSSFAVARPAVDSGKAVVLAVSNSRRAANLPQVPTAAEAGFAGLQFETTAGFYGPRGMPLALRERIGKDITDAASDPAIGEKLVASGQIVNLGGPADLAKTLDDQATRAAEVAKVLGMAKKSGG